MQKCLSIIEIPLVKNDQISIIEFTDRIELIYPIVIKYSHHIIILRLRNIIG